MDNLQIPQCQLMWSVEKYARSKGFRHRQTSPSDGIPRHSPAVRIEVTCDGKAQRAKLTGRFQHTIRAVLLKRMRIVVAALVYQQSFRPLCLLLLQPYPVRCALSSAVRFESCRRGKKIEGMLDIITQTLRHATSYINVELAHLLELLGCRHLVYKAMAHTKLYFARDRR